VGMRFKPALTFFSTVALVFAVPAAAQRKTSKQPVKIVDITSRELIPEVLVLPTYGSFAGVAVYPGGQAKGSDRDYLDNPFIYRPGTAFKLNRGSFVGLPLGFVFIGKYTDMWGVMLVAKGYHPVLVSEYQLDEREEVVMTPVTDIKWDEFVKKEFESLVSGSKRINNCKLWFFPEKCEIEIRFDRKERELVQSFLKQTN
ncbi:MAG TPA: hypothetical protein VNA17_08410, partial [Pyrinomonadaceae bacterium]|nr:hypothetical protein [Pyrinomonadaceae bacterium]